MKSSRTVGFVAVVALTLACPPSLTAEQRAVEAAKQVLDKYKDAVVWVTATVKVEALSGGKPVRPAKTRKTRAIGVVIDASGLTAVPRSRINPSASVFSMMPRGHAVTMKTDFSGVRMRLSDGSEVPAKVVSIDADLDIAFVMPDEKPEKLKGGRFVAVDPAQGPKADVLDELIVISRLGKGWDYEPTIWLSRVSAVLNSRGTRYLATPLEQGAPVFTADARFLGVAAMVKPRGARMTRYYMVVLPAGDVLAAAKRRKSTGHKPTNKTGEVEKK